MEISKQNYLAHLNKNQKKAVIDLEGPCLIVAGAGSGKTRVLTEKIAHLVDEVGIPPEHILSVTFTNKAAGEMKERILKIISCDVSRMTVGTFHSVCAALLRKHIHLLDYDNNFTKRNIVDLVSKLVPNPKIKILAKGQDKRNYRVNFKKIKIGSLS